MDAKSLAVAVAAIGVVFAAPASAEHVYSRPPMGGGQRGGGEGSYGGGSYGGGHYGGLPGVFLGGGWLHRPPPDEVYRPEPEQPPEDYRPRPRPHPRPVRLPPADNEDEPPPAPVYHPVHEPVAVARPKPSVSPTYVAPVAKTKPAPPRSPNPPPLAVARGLPPAAGEVRYRAGEVLVETSSATSAAAVVQTLRRHGLVEAEATPIDLLGVTLRVWRIPDARNVAAVIGELGADTTLTRIQPNYLYRPADEPAPAATPSVHAELSSEQYSLAKLHVDPSLEVEAGEPIRVAVIDTAVDERHPDLAGAVEAQFDAIGGGAAVRSRDHGTAMAGGIAARGRVRGVATNVKILSARAFDADGAGGALGSTVSIVKGLDWSAKMKARIVNLSFAGPSDPTLHDGLAAALGRGMVLVGAAGNAGPNSPPLYPGADPSVIAATATDADDKLFAQANVGAYVAISAPGVDVLLPAPDGGYSLETGTSVSSALISGVVALILEHQATLSPAKVRKRLSETAAPIGGAGHASEFGAGLADAKRAVGTP